MVRETQGIEIFGGNATTIDAASRAEVPRSAALGAASVLIALLAAVAFVAAVIERDGGHATAPIFTAIALGASTLAMFAGAAAVLTGRGRLAGFVGVLFGAVSNPWLLGLALTWLEALPTG